jgi:CBS domain-containing protein
MAATSLAERFAAPGGRPLPVLEREVSELMSPGVISIVENAPMTRVFDAFAAHRVHALVVCGGQTGRPIGWITARGLLAWMGSSRSAAARDAITERAVAVRPTATGEQALEALLKEGVSHLLVQQTPSGGAEGVLSERDLVAASRR